MGAKRPSEPTPWCLFGFFLGIQKEARRSQGGEIPLRKPLGTARRAAAPYRSRSLPSGRPHGAAPAKNPNQGGFTGKKQGRRGQAPALRDFSNDARSLKCPLIRLALRPATFPIPPCRFATSPLDKGSRPPGGRLKKSRHQNPHAQKGKQPGRAEADGLLIHEAGWDWSGILGSSSGMSSPEITSSISSSLSTSSWGKRSFTRSRTVVR